MNDVNGQAQILAFLAEHRRDFGPRLLDVPSGGGPVVEGARAAGYDVVELDLFPRPRMRGVCADACAPLPFRDGAFDVVLSMEGIEHFEHQAGFVRECARVLRPGGWLLLTTPNVLSLSARAAHLLTGGRVRSHGFINEATTLYKRDGRRLYHGHAFLIDAFRLRYLLRLADLELRELRGTMLSPSSLLLAPLVPCIRLANRTAARRMRRRIISEAQRIAGEGRLPAEALAREMRGLANSSALFFSKKLIFLATKALHARPGTPPPAE